MASYIILQLQDQIAWLKKVNSDAYEAVHEAMDLCQQRPTEWLKQSRSEQDLRQKVFQALEMRCLNLAPLRERDTRPKDGDPLGAPLASSPVPEEHSPNHSQDEIPNV
jgi:hypothetical protein